MPQIDFRQAFASADPKPLPPGSAQIAQSDRADNQVDQNARRLSVGASRFDRSSWANIAFVAVTVVGGLFCAFYFFNGAELLRAAAAWPREFLYSRPFGVVGNGKIDKLNGADDPASPFGTKSPPSSKGDPFPNVGLPGLNQPPPFGSPTAGTFASPSGPVSSPAIPPSLPSLPPPLDPGPLLGGLNPFPAGTDALSQAFNKAVADLQRISNLNARRTVVVIETAPSAARMRAAKAAQNAKRAAQIAAAKAAGLTGKTAQGLQQTSQNATAAVQNQAASAQNQAAAMSQRAGGMGQQTLGGVSGVTGSGLSGLGGMGGLGGLGGLGGGGGLGGLGGGVHGGGGGGHH